MYRGQPQFDRFWAGIVLCIGLLLLAIFVETAVNIYRALKATFSEPLVAVLLAIVFMILPLAMVLFRRVHPEVSSRRILIPMGLFLLMTYFIVALELFSSTISAQYYVNAVRQYRRAVVEDRAHELAADSAREGCTSEDTLRSTGCGQTGQQYRKLIELRTSEPSPGEDQLTFARRIYDGVRDAECKNLDHIAKLDALREVNPYDQRRDTLSLWYFWYVTLPSASSFTVLIFIIPVLFLHLAAFIFEPILAKNSTAAALSLKSLFGSLFRGKAVGPPPPAVQTPPAEGAHLTSPGKAESSPTDGQSLGNCLASLEGSDGQVLSGNITKEADQPSVSAPELRKTVGSERGASPRGKPSVQPKGNRK